MTLNKLIKEIQDQYLMACSKRQKSDRQIYLTPTIMLYYSEYEGHSINQVYDYIWFDDDRKNY